MSKALYLNGKLGSIIGNYAIVDDDLYDELNQYTWRIQRAKCKNMNKFYIFTVTGSRRKRKHIMLHRMVLNITDPSIQVDHINGDGRDNRIENLRACTQNQNLGNQGPRPGTSQYKGVSIMSNGKFKASVAGNYLGIFDKEEDAAIASDIKAIELYDEFAYLNFPNNDYKNINYPKSIKMVSNTGYKYISYSKSRERYYVTSYQNNKKHIKFFKDLSDAINYKKEVISDES